MTAERLVNLYDTDGQRLRRGRDQGAQPRARPCADHRRQSAPRCRSQTGIGDERKSAKRWLVIGWLKISATTSAAARNGSTYQPQGQSRWSNRPGARAGKGDVSSDVRRQWSFAATQIIRLGHVAPTVERKKDRPPPPKISGDWAHYGPSALRKCRSGGKIDPKVPTRSVTLPKQPESALVYICNLLLSTFARASDSLALLVLCMTSSPTA